MTTGSLLAFQTATLDDIEVLAKMMEALYRHDSHPFDAAQARRATRRLLELPAFGAIWLLRQDNETVGYAVLTFGFSLEFGGCDALLDELFVVESYRRKGLGQQALRFIADRCRENEIRALHLEVLSGNDKAAAIYRRFGFEEDTRRLMTKWLD